MKSKLIAFALCAALAAGALTGCGKTEEKKAPESSAQPAHAAQASKTSAAPTEKVNLFVYSGAGLKKAMEDVKAAYEKDNPDITLEMNYNGSGKLLAQLQASKKGDLFIVGAKHDYENAQKEGLVKDGRGVANHTPAIVVQKGNPKGIKTLADLAKPGIEVVLADPASASIGKTAQKIFEKNHLTDINKNVKAQVDTVNAIVAAIQAKNADAGICTKDSIHDAKDIEIIDIPADQNVNQVINASICTSTEHEAAAKKFLEFLTSERGKKIFDSYGFTPAS